MCDEHERPQEPSSGFLARLSRRRVLQGAVAVAALAGLAPGRSATAAPLAAGATNADGLTARALAMHLHASASEGVGSVRSQLAQAALNGFDVAWFTDHDWRRHRLLFRRTYSFTANEGQFGGTWNVPRMAGVGSLTSTSGGTLVTSPVTPTDTATRKGSLRMRATSTGSARATARNRIAAEGSSRANFRGRIAGRTVVVDVLPSRSGPNAWGEVQFRLSHHPGSGTRPTGVLTLTYRLRTDITTRARRVATGLAGVVDVPVRAGSWQTVTLDPTADVAAVWPGIQARDNSLNEIRFHAVSRRRILAEYFFGHLRFVEQQDYDAVGVETALLAAYAGTEPGVLGLNGSEISLGPHVNQYGGELTPYRYGDVTLDSNLDELRPHVVRHVHDLGGLACINHPFKPGAGNSAVTAQSLAADLISTALDGADLLEVGYASRGTNGTLSAHLAAWDAVSRNGLFVTGNGVSDDHSGQNWSRQTNRFWTGAWTATLNQPALLAALSAGRSFVGLLGSFSGAVDMSIDDAPMGSALVGPGTQRTLWVDVTGLPSGGAVQVLRGDVDYEGAASPVPNTRVVRTLGASDLSSSKTLGIDTTDECFYRLQVIDGAGAVIGFGQPTWALHATPGTGVPSDRLVTG
jgi:hypothetical protein